MNAQTAHTPTPWIKRFVSTGAGDGFWMIGIETGNPMGLAVCKVTGQMSPEIEEANTELILQAVNSHAQLVEQNEQMRSLLSQMLDAAENADETGYVADLGFIDLDKLHAEVRAALNPPPTK